MYQDLVRVPRPLGMTQRETYQPVFQVPHPLVLVGEVTWHVLAGSEYMSWGRTLIPSCSGFLKTSESPLVSGQRMAWPRATGPGLRLFIDVVVSPQEVGGREWPFLPGEETSSFRGSWRKG